MFSLLERRNNRMLLQYFNEREVQEASLSELSGYVRDCELAAGRSPHPQSIEAALRYTYLPMVEDAGVVTFDPERDAVVYRGSPRLERYVTLVIEEGGERTGPAGS